MDVNGYPINDTPIPVGTTIYDWLQSYKGVGGNRSRSIFVKSGNINGCSPHTIQLKSYPANSYQWYVKPAGSGGSIILLNDFVGTNMTINGTSTQTLSITINNNYVCGDEFFVKLNNNTITSNSITLNVNRTPPTTTITSSNGCTSGTLTSSGSTVYTRQWYKNTILQSGKTTASIGPLTASDAGNWTASLAKYGCVGPQSAGITINSCRSGEIEEFASSTTISPIPASNMVNITLAYEAPATIQFTYIDGKLVKETTTNQQSNDIDISTLQAGFYIVNIVQEELVTRKKFQVVK